MEKWPQNIPQEVSTIKNKFAVHGQHYLYKDKRVCIKPSRDRLEAIKSYNHLLW